MTKILYSPEDNLSYLEIIDTTDGKIYSNTLSQKAPPSVDRNNNIVEPEHRAVDIIGSIKDKFIVHAGYVALDTLDGVSIGSRLIALIEKDDMLNNIENYTTINYS